MRRNPNSKCTCGSGKKSKKCCGKLLRTPEPESEYESLVQSLKKVDPSAALLISQALLAMGPRRP